MTGVKSDEWAGPDRAQQVKWFIYLTDWAYLTLTIATLVDAAVVVFVRVKRRDIAKGMIWLSLCMTSVQQKVLNMFIRIEYRIIPYIH